MAAETFFHHVEPSTRIIVHLNPAVGRRQGKVSETSEEVGDRVSLFGRLKAFIGNRLVGIKKSLKTCRRSSLSNGSVNMLLHVISVAVALRRR